MKKIQINFGMTDMFTFYGERWKGVFFKIKELKKINLEDLKKNDQNLRKLKSIFKFMF